MGLWPGGFPEAAGLKDNSYLYRPLSQDNASFFQGHNLKPRNFGFKNPWLNISQRMGRLREFNHSLLSLMGWGGGILPTWQSLHLEATAAEEHNVMASLSVRQSNPRGSIPGHSLGTCHTVLGESPSISSQMCTRSSCLVSRSHLWIICVAVTVPREKQTSLFPPQIKHRKQIKTISSESGLAIQWAYQDLQEHRVTLK